MAFGWSFLRRKGPFLASNVHSGRRVVPELLVPAVLTPPQPPILLVVVGQFQLGRGFDVSLDVDGNAGCLIDTHGPSCLISASLQAMSFGSI